MSPNNYKSKGRQPGPSDGRGQRNKAQSGHSPADSRGQVRRDLSGRLTTSSPYEPEHRYESLKRGKDKVDQVSEYGHYIEIVS